MPSRLLVVEDDHAAADYLTQGLRREGYTVDLAANGPDALHMAVSARFDAIVLDLLLPGVDGLAVLKALRAAQKDTPVLILSALAQTDDRIRGLRAGADDYLAKPYSFSELQLRLEILLRKRSASPEETKLRCGDLVLDLLTRAVTRGGRTISLLPREYQILEHLLRCKGKVVTRTLLLEQVWDYRFEPHTSLIDTHMSRLRKKIDDGFDVTLIHTVRGVGYRISDAA